MQAAEKDLDDPLLAALGAVVEGTDGVTTLDEVGRPVRFEVEEGGEVRGLVAIPGVSHGTRESPEALIHRHSGGVTRDGDVAVDGVAHTSLPLGQFRCRDGERVGQLYTEHTPTEGW